MNSSQLASPRLQGVDICPLCESPQRERFERDPSSASRIRVWRCGSCGLLYADPVVAAEDLAQFYAGYSERGKRDDPNAGRQRAAQYALDYGFVRRHYDDEVSRILDVGCREGEFLSHFNQSAQKFGVELDRIALAQGQLRHPDMTFFDSLDSLSGHKFDAILFRGTLQYMPDLGAIVDFCAESVVPNGMLFLLVTPNSNSLLAQLQRENWALLDPIEHRYTFSLRNLRSMFAPAFDVVEYDLPYLGTPYERYEVDLAKVLKMFYSPTARQVHTPFFGSLVNMAFRRANRR